MEVLRFSESVTHLGHVLHSKLEDDDDVTRVTAAMCRQAYYLLRGV